ncbi:hypothetical protein H0E87_019353 [Populus deltoides]|uniref:Uncharacterized protein n=1 Tax=Populus deltoides TaxID=3696 RepID=A0A8T2XUD7_POPDE|nr:hypothetical protein H0E87_019353 [Populus deltoides]
MGVFYCETKTRAIFKKKRKKYGVEVGGEFHAWKQNIEKGRKDRQQVHSIENHSVWDLDGQDQLGLLGIPRNEDFSRYYINNQQLSDCTATEASKLSICLTVSLLIQVKCQNLQPIAPPHLFCTFRPRIAICYSL